MHDLFGSLLCLSLEKKIDMTEVLSYPSTPVPLPLSYSDNGMLNSRKSNLMLYLETFAVSETLEVVHETIIDATLFLHCHVNLPNTCEAIARYILGRIVNPFSSRKWNDLALYQAKGCNFTKSNTPP